LNCQDVFTTGQTLGGIRRGDFNKIGTCGATRGPEGESRIAAIERRIVIRGDQVSVGIIQPDHGIQTIVELALMAPGCECLQMDRMVADSDGKRGLQRTETRVLVRDPNTATTQIEPMPIPALA
jgi:hypothetical protein